jgi:hypothetical protein
MNTRGLTEIVILQVGLQLGVLSPTMFTLMVLMALITTAMTGPLMRRIYPDRVLDRELAALEAAEQAGLGGPASYTVLVAVPQDPTAARRAAQLARELTGREVPARIVLCRLLTAAAPLEVAGGMGADLAVLAQVGDELRALAGELSDAGTAASVVVRFAADPAADLAALAARLDADAVLLIEEPSGPVDDGDGSPGPAGSGAAAWLQALDAVPDVTVVVADDGAEPAGTRVAVVVDGGAGGRAAVRMGAQLALHTGADLAVAPADRRRARRSGAAVAALTRRGIHAEGVDDPAGAGLLVLPVDLPAPESAGASAVLRVRAAAADSDDDMEQVVDRIGTGAPSEA